MGAGVFLAFQGRGENWVDGGKREGSWAKNVNKGGGGQSFFLRFARETCAQRAAPWWPVFFAPEDILEHPSFPTGDGG